MVAALLLVSGAIAQDISNSQQTAPSSSEQKPREKAGPQQRPDSDAESGKQSESDSSKSESKITPEQAQQLFSDVDTILDFASKDTDLPIKHEVKRRLASREEVVSYLQKNMAEDKDVQRLKRT